MRVYGVAWAIALGLSGCGADPITPADLSAASDGGGASLTLTVAGVARPMAAWYSFYVQPLNDDGPPGTYLVVTADSLGMAKDEMAAKPLVLYQGADMVALASEEGAIRAVLDREIDTHDPYEGEVMVWSR